MALVTEIYSVTYNSPKDEIYSLTSQIRRAAVSIPSNIADGKAKHSTNEFMRFLWIARGSLAELETQLMIGQNLSYVSPERLEFLLNATEEIGKMLSGLLSKLESLKANT